MKLISSKTNLFSSLPWRPSPFSLPHHSPSPPIPQPHSPSCISGFNTNPQRPDCAYNTPWIDKPLISSLSSLSKHPGFEVFFLSFFLTSLWGPGLFPVEKTNPKLTSGDRSERAVRSWQDQTWRHGAQGIELCTCTDLGGGMRLTSFSWMFLSPVLIGDAFRV